MLRVKVARLQLHDEEQSAKRCSEELTTLGISAATIKESARLILLSKKHTSKENNSWDNAFINADFMILASPWQRYHEYARQIRREYASVPLDNFLAGRIAFLERFVAKETIFCDGLYSATLEQHARKNMLRELALLKHSPEDIVGNHHERTLYEWPQQVLAITGTIGSGKSTVLRELQSLGAFVVGADNLVHELYRQDRSLQASIIEIGGDDVIDQHGAIDRIKLDSIVFNDPLRRAALERLIHPKVHRCATQEFVTAIMAGKTFLVYELPLLFQYGLEALQFKKTIGIVASEDLCIKRIVERSQGKLSQEDARSRIASQISTEEIQRRADVVIDNSGSLEQLRELLKFFCYTHSLTPAKD